jgi:Na+-transporting NADH:ubiquinone oxidoreductase subunit C
MSSSLKSLAYAAALCVVCSLLLTAASSGLQPFQERNVLIDRHRNILEAAGVLADGQEASAAEVERLYSERIRPLRVDSTGRILPAAEPAEVSLPIYLFTVPSSGEEVEGYIIPIDTKGLWGPIHGYLALGTDGSTVRGFTVYKHSETPGLGGEIEKRWFRENWVGKQIVSQEGKFVSIGIAKGRVVDIVPKEKQPHYVDGISGATLTGKYLSAGIRDILSQYEPVSIKFRNNRIQELSDQLAVPKGYGHGGS